MFRLVPCLFVCIAKAIAFYGSRFCTINSLEYFNLLVLVKLFLESSIYMQQAKIKIKNQSYIGVFRTILRHTD